MAVPIRQLDKIDFYMQDGTTVTVNTPDADAALQAFQNALGNVGERTYINIGGEWLNLKCICRVVPGDYVESTVTGYECKTIDCIEDWG